MKIPKMKEKKRKKRGNTNWEKTAHRKEREITKTERESFRITEWKIVSTGMMKKKYEHIWRWHTIVKQHIWSSFFFISNRTKLLLCVFFFFSSNKRIFSLEVRILSHFSFLFMLFLLCVTVLFVIWKQDEKNEENSARESKYSLTRTRTHTQRKKRVLKSPLCRKLLF